MGMGGDMYLEEQFSDSVIENEDTRRTDTDVVDFRRVELRLLKGSLENFRYFHCSRTL